MLEPIIDRLFSYKEIMFDLSEKYFSELFNFLKNFNRYMQLISKKIKYKYDLKLCCYRLGKYLSGNKDKKYDFSVDKKFIFYMERIKSIQEIILATNKTLKKMKEQERN